MRREACGFGDLFGFSLFGLLVFFHCRVVRTSEALWGLRLPGRGIVRETTFCFSSKTCGLIKGMSPFGSGGGGAAAAGGR